MKIQAQAFLDLVFDAAPPREDIFSVFSSSALKRHLLKRHLTLSDKSLWPKFFPSGIQTLGHCELSNPKAQARSLPCPRRLEESRVVRSAQASASAQQLGGGMARWLASA